MHVDIIASEERGVTENEWLYSKHTYSFGKYHNLKRLNFGTLRVFNDDIVQPGKGFETHHHENMEIITIVLEGSLEHKDNQGNHGILKPEDVQRITAGRGIEHSEFNASKEEPVHFLQIWVYPNRRDLDPSYEQKNIALKKNVLRQIVSPTASKTTLMIHQDATFFLGFFDAEKSIEHTPKTSRYGNFIFLIEGKLAVDDKVLIAGDSAQFIQIDKLKLHTLEPSKILMIEVDVNTL